MADLRFPKGFLWGVATSSHQIEGGNRNNWSAWESVNGHIKDGTVSGVAADNWNRYPEDYRYMSDMHLGTYRLSVEWSRIEPTPGEYNQAAFDHYGKMLTDLKKRGIKPMITLHHFTNPLWVEELGGWESPEVVDAFVRFGLKVVQEFGADVQLWCTVNEPSVEIGLGYMVGIFPPGRKNLFGFLKARRHLVVAHRRLYSCIHELYRTKGWKTPQVSLAHHVTYVEPRNPHNPLDRLAAWIYDLINNAYFMRRTATTADFIGINYYFYRRLYAHWGGPLFLMAEAPIANVPASDLNWQVVPEGLYRVCLSAAKYKKPIYVTENGLADSGDILRPWSIVQHAKAVHQAIAAGADVRGYFHWTLTDTFEWENGYRAKYGLVAVDFATQKRTPRPSAKLYGQIASQNALTDEMLETYK